MKFKTLTACVLAFFLAVSGGDMYAQTRKKSGGVKKTATAPAKKKAAASTYKLTAANLNDRAFIGEIIMPELAARLGKNVGFSSWLSLGNSGSITWTMVTKDLEGSWTLSGGSAIDLTSGNFKSRLTTDDGRVFKGKVTTDGIVWDAVYYIIKEGKFTPESLKQSFNKNTLRALLEVDSPSGEIVFPVDIKMGPSADGTGGTYKFTADNALGLGLIKGTYTFTENSVKFTSNLDGCSEKEVDLSKRQRECIPVLIGTKYIQSVGRCKIYLWLFNQ